VKKFARTGKKRYLCTRNRKESNDNMVP